MNSWKEAKKILCIRLDAMGDVLMTTPAMEALKESVPGRSISLLTSPEGKEISASLPVVDNVISYRAPWLKSGAGRNDPQFDLNMISILQSEQFDAAVIFTVFSQNPLPAALLSYLAGIPLRAAHCRENPYALLTDWIKEPEPDQMIRHEVRRQLDLVHALGAKGFNRHLGISVNEMALDRVLGKLFIFGIPQADRNWIVIHPGSTAESRRYPPEKFASVAEMLYAAGNKILFTGGESERELILAIQSKMKFESINLAGKLELKELIALLSLAPLLLSNNSGPVHLASALGTPVVDLYALTNPQHTPWMVSHSLLYKDMSCKYCFKSICPEKHNLCLSGIEVREIFDRCISLKRINFEPQFDSQAVHPLQERL